MIHLLLVFSAIHVVFFLVLAIGWRSIPLATAKSVNAQLSVIIPVRNEEGVIEKLLRCLEMQEYEKDSFEVLVVDDFSEDGTRELVKSLCKELDMNVKLICLDNPLESGKKRALTKGVENAAYDFIITTDADCVMGPYWLASYAAGIHDNKFLAGPVALKGKGLFSSLQQVEFSGLIGFGAVTLNNNNPSMCSGANLGFDKSAFFEVGGYTNNLMIPSGDDEFLLFNIQRAFPGKVSFLKSKYAIVVSQTHTSLGAFVNQRIRWTSKWKYNKNIKLRLMAVLFFIDYSLFGLAIALTFLNELSLLLLISILFFRWFSNFLYISPIQRFTGNRNLVLPILVMQIIYPFHVFFMGVNSIFGHYTWKGRNY